MKKIATILKFSLILILITGWIFSGWPTIWQNPRIPPEIQEAQAATTIFLTTGTTWTVPADWNNANNTIEVIGGGGGGETGAGSGGTANQGGGGGGGGAYSKISNLTLTPSSSVTIQIGAGGGANANGTDTFFNRTAGTAGTCADTVSVCAKAGNAGTFPVHGTGGASASGVGTTKASGGNGGNGQTVKNTNGGGGGGAAGCGAATCVAGSPGGAGNAGADSVATATGGQGDSTFGGAGGAAGSGVGGNGTEWDATHGSGGGGGGASANGTAGGAGGNFGAGGGGGRGSGGVGGVGIQGIIVIIYTSATSLTFTIDTNSVTFTGGITPGTPVSTSSVLTVNTNNATGYQIAVVRASTTPTLFLSTDTTRTILDTPNGNNWTAPIATSTAGPSAVWTNGTTQGLGFRVKQTGTVSNTYSSTWWGTDDTAANALYSGIATSTASVANSMIANTTLGAGANENTTVEYRLDTAKNQKSGVYISSPITYTATTNP